MQHQEIAKNRFILMATKGQYLKNDSIVKQRTQNKTGIVNKTKQLYSNIMLVKGTYDLCNELYLLLNNPMDAQLRIASRVIFKTSIPSANTMDLSASVIGNYNFGQNIMDQYLQFSPPKIQSDLSFLPKSSIADKFSNLNSQNEKFFLNTMQCIRERLSFNKTQKSKSLKFQPFIQDQYFEKINEVVRMIVIDANLNSNPQKNESPGEFFERHLNESNKAYMPSIIGCTSKYLGTTLGMIKGTFTGNSYFQQKDYIVRFSDYKSKMMFAIQDGLAKTNVKL